MTLSPTEEIRRIRHALAEQFDNDPDRIFEDLLRKQREWGGPLVRLPARPPCGRGGANVPPAESLEPVES